MSELEQAYFPSWRLGYRCNPFRALTRQEWIGLASIPDALQERLDDLPQITQILGNPGSGKTSALLALRREFAIRGRAATYEYIPAGSSRITANLSDLYVYLLDEAQRLAARRLDKLVRLSNQKGKPNPRLILSTHEDLTDAAAAHGLSMLNVSLDAHSNHFIQELVERRLNYFERPGQRGVRLTREALVYAQVRCHSNLRLVERLLYEAYQTWTETTPIDLEYLRSIDLS